MPSCFVIMPLTTPLGAVTEYGGDSDHFIHVLDHLFAPAVEAAGYELIKPIMRGADLIHAEIIRNLEQSDLVLCDVSQLNANVFFELGIRTALDRPVALVKDDRTATYPFDTSMINYHSYRSSLAPWTLQTDIALLQKHLEDSQRRADGRNSLWRYFGLTQRATPAVIDNPLEAKLDLVVAELEKLKDRDHVSVKKPSTSPYMESLEKFLGLEVLSEKFIKNLNKAYHLEGRRLNALAETLDKALNCANKFNAEFRIVHIGASDAVLDLGPYGIPAADLDLIRQSGKVNGISVNILQHTLTKGDAE